MTSKEKLDAIERIKEELNNKAGEQYITSLTDGGKANVEVIPTGVLGVDIALGVGGIPTRRITEIYGPEQSGKTTIALQIAAMAQRLDKSILYVDAEHALDPAYCAALGLDPTREDFVIAQPDWGEQGLDAAMLYARKGAIDLIIIDSIAALTPKKKLEMLAGDVSEDGNTKDVEDGDFELFQKFVGLHARMMAGFCSVIPQVIRKNDIALIGLNQIRKDITPMGAREAQPGGNAFRHAASVRIDVRRIGAPKTSGNKEDSSYTGISAPTKALVRKNKVGPPFRQAVYDLSFGRGIEYYPNLIEVCNYHKIGVKKSGGWYTTIDIDTGEAVGKGKRESTLVEWYKNDEDGQKHCSAMIDALSEAVGINLYDPARPERTVSVIPDAEVDVELTKITDPKDMELIMTDDNGEEDVA